MVIFSFFLLTNFTPLGLAAEDVGDVIFDLKNVAADAKIIEGEAEPTIYDYVGRFINLFLAFIGIIFLIITIYAGFRWMMAKGNEAEIEKATKLLENSAIGLFIIIAAYVLVNYAIFNFIDILK